MESIATYYNEIDRQAAEWLRELMTAGLIPDGDVDERDIRDVRADDLRHYEQCHFFAGIGGWPHALRLAGWKGPVWTGSCPCQPFSVAGKGCGEDDERHLWPAFRRLISECRPPVVFGEQVAGKDGLLWLAGVRADLEADGYVVGAADLCAAGIGAPHIRQRLWWVANPQGTGRCIFDTKDNGAAYAQIDASSDASGGCNGRVADSKPQHDRAGKSRSAGRVEFTDGGGVGISDCSGSQQGVQASAPVGYGRPVEPANFWGASVWWPCIDGKWRRVPARQDKFQGRDGTNTAAHEIQTGTLCPEPSLFPLASGVSCRVGLLRGAGNAIVPQVAAEFIKAVMDL